MLPASCADAAVSPVRGKTWEAFKWMLLNHKRPAQLISLRGRERWFLKMVTQKYSHSSALPQKK